MVPLTDIQALQRDFILEIRQVIISFVQFGPNRSATLFLGEVAVAIALPVIPRHMCSRVKISLWPIHPAVSPLSRNSVYSRRALCDLALSSIKMNSGPCTEANRGSRSHPYSYFSHPVTLPLSRQLGGRCSAIQRACRPLSRYWSVHMDIGGPDGGSLVLSI
ncbi:hypothetical protein AVEN_29654-1 [Araneus ventricosus]|uniref:Uncharacterized protein n=1 Tax=Araneus ventricosus TaxID=182803 RepID=A0A4Y2R385_ARAVE|nr:hypothetical protein AVEN_29654-1 [Araneus ventricosus]